MNMRREFPEDFVWGTATASYQVEGAAFEDEHFRRKCADPGSADEPPGYGIDHGAQQRSD